MRIKLQNIGPVHEAEISLGPLTIICGKNNTGKTYATYALYGFLSYWEAVFFLDVSDEDIENLLKDGSVRIDLDQYIESSQSILDKACTVYTSRLDMVFSSSDENFYDSKFSIDIEKKDIKIVDKFERFMGGSKNELFSIIKKNDVNYVEISLLVERDKVKVPAEIIKRIIGSALKDIVFGNTIPHPFITSAERTGGAIFRKELNFAKNRILDELGTKGKKFFDPVELINKAFAEYALPIKVNVDFIRDLESICKDKSYIIEKHPDIVKEFDNIAGGRYQITKEDRLYYIPKGKKIRLTMGESSSSVRSLLDLGFYLRHVAEKGDLLIIDEPELNLHPANQRRVARLFSRLVNVGINIFITTHSDYIIKEFNTLIMMNSDKEYIQKIMLKEGYVKDELLDCKNIKAYMTQTASFRNQRGKHFNIITPATIKGTGIILSSFDETIDEMNRIQDEILWGE